MIKFNFIIHKETGTVIKYDDWKEKFNKDFYIRFTKGDKFKWSYKPKEMLFTNEFEIIYNSEFTLQELALLFDKVSNKELSDKILNLCIEKKSIKDKYGIDI